MIRVCNLRKIRLFTARIKRNDSWINMHLTSCQDQGTGSPPRGFHTQFVWSMETATHLWGFYNQSISGTCCSGRRGYLA